MKIIVIVLLLSLLSGCGDGDDNGNHAVLAGVWITEKCEQAVDANGAAINIWGRGLYEFTTQGTITVGQVTYSDQGTIRLGHVAYSDSNCVVVMDTTVPAELAQPVLYRDLGETVLQGGVAGGALTISPTTAGSV